MFGDFGRTGLEGVSGLAFGEPISEGSGEVSIVVGVWEGFGGGAVDAGVSEFLEALVYVDAEGCELVEERGEVD
jgi:hypothetical protein